MDIIRKTIENDEEYLRQISEEVDLSNDNYKSDIKLLEEYCLQTSCFALASVQIGIPKRMIYLKNTKDIDRKDITYNEGKVIINPIVIRRKGHSRFWEGCLSCMKGNKQIAGLTDRPYEIEVEYFDEFKNKHKEVFSEFPAIVLSHEMDHLDGVLHMDIATDIKVVTNEELKELRKKYPLEIISKEDNYEKKV